MSDAEQTLPLDNWHRRLGARMVPFAGYAMPIQYEGIIAEPQEIFEARRVGLAGRGCVECTGSGDAFRSVNRGQ